MPLTTAKAPSNPGMAARDNVAVTESGRRSTWSFSDAGERAVLARAPSRVSQGSYDGAQKHRSEDHRGDAEHWEKHWPDPLQCLVTSTSPKRCAHPTNDGEDVRDEGHGAPARSKLIDRK